MDEHLSALDLKPFFQRLVAVDGEAERLDRKFPGRLTPGELGCYLSHLRALVSHAKKDRHLHILEDDSVLSSLWLASIEEVSRWLEQRPWDLFFTHVGFHINSWTLSYFSRLRQCQRDQGGLVFFNLREVQEFGGLQSYVVNHKSIGRIARMLMSPGWQNIPVDMVIKRLVMDRQLQAYGVAPFLSSVEHSLQLQSTLRESRQAQKLLRGILLNDVMYVGADPATLKRKYVDNGGRQPDSLSFLEAAVRSGPAALERDGSFRNW
jgi:GR25 family glycosyltransferase involved in LPS biosynthesis